VINTESKPADVKLFLTGSAKSGATFVSDTIAIRDGASFSFIASPTVSNKPGPIRTR